MNMKVLLLGFMVLGAAAPAPAQEEGVSEVDAAPAPRKKPAKKKPKARPDPVIEEVEQPPLEQARKAAARYRTDEPAGPDEDEADSFPAPTPGRTAPAKPKAPPRRSPIIPLKESPGRSPIIPLAVPRHRRVRALTLYLEETGERAVVEDQASSQPNSIVNVGRGTASEIDFEGARVRDQRAIENLAAVFYVFSGVIRLKEMELTPAFLKKGDELIDSGDTPPVFKIEVLELSRIGDTDGNVLKTMEDVSFRIGENNPVPLNVEVSSGKKVGVRLSLPDERAPAKTMFLQFKAAKKGKFPVNVVATKARGSEKRVVYSPQVRFSFVPNHADLDTFSNPTESLIGQINRYVERRARGGEGDIAVPLRVKVEYR